MPVHTRTPRGPLDTVRALKHAAEGAGHAGFFASTKWWATPPYVCVTESGRTNIGGVEKVFDAEITEQIPEKQIAWRSTSGAPNTEVVTFHPLSANTTRTMLQLDYEPERLIEKAGDLLGVAAHRVKSDLERFKDLMSLQAPRQSMAGKDRAGPLIGRRAAFGCSKNYR
jgi:hypothetical protein